MASAAPNFTHMGVFTDRPEAMQLFYSAVLGMAVSDRGLGTSFRRQIIFMTGDPLLHHQFVLVVREEGDPPGGALFQASFKVKSLTELREVTARATAHAARDLREINHGNAWSVYFRDPDDNMVEVYMDTGWYVPQPFSDPLPLSLSDSEIEAITDARVKTVPGAKPQEEWTKEMAQRLNEIRGRP
jgi:catechol 2,3-dioxygenase